MLKKISITLSTLILAIFLIFSNIQPLKATVNVESHFIFNQISFQAGERVKLTINLENFANLSGVKLTIKCNESIMTPVAVDNKYFQFNSASFCRNTILNEYNSNNYLKLDLISDKEGGYNFGYKNNVCEIEFITTIRIDNIYQFFVQGIDTVNLMGYNLYLFDTHDNLINYTTTFSERIRLEWNVDKYIVEVYDEYPDYSKDIVIKNRLENEYEIIADDNIKTDILGSQVINVIIIDKLNVDYLVFSRIVEVVDTTRPTINGLREIAIADSEVEHFDYLNYVMITDNYDNNVKSSCQYFDELMNPLADKGSFIDYLSHHLYANIQVRAVDSSNNEALPFNIKITVEDTTAPTINVIDQLTINDYDVDDFDILDILHFEDSYDDNPQLIFIFKDNNGQLIEDYLEYLRKGEIVVIEYFVRDNSNNTTDTYTLRIIPSDTTAPTIAGVNDININDTQVNNYDFSWGIVATDNYDLNPTLLINYYQVISRTGEIIDEVKKLDLEEFKINLKKGLECYIEYRAIDKSGNISGKIIQNIKVKDTTSPTITVVGIKDGNKYVSVGPIEYSIEDNFVGDLDITVTLNGEEYKFTSITKQGTYILEINAIDQAENHSSFQLTFHIIENNIIGCGNNFECYIDNYFELVIIVASIMVVVITIITIKIINIRRRRANKG